MANKNRYYGLSTKEERQDVTDNSRAARIYPETFGYRAIVTAILNYKDINADFDEFNTTAAAKALAKLLTNTELYGKVTSSSGRLYGENYAISLTKKDGLITVSHRTEQINEDERKR